MPTPALKTCHYPKVPICCASRTPSTRACSLLIPRHSVIHTPASRPPCAPYARPAALEPAPPLPLSGCISRCRHPAPVVRAYLTHNSALPEPRGSDGPAPEAPPASPLLRSSARWPRRAAQPPRAAASPLPDRSSALCETLPPTSGSSTTGPPRGPPRKRPPPARLAEPTLGGVAAAAA